MPIAETIATRNFENIAGVLYFIVLVCVITYVCKEAVRQIKIKYYERQRLKQQKEDVIL